ncbi:MAG: cyanophycinase, partial [Chitinophagaceae bacterium]
MQKLPNLVLCSLLLFLSFSLSAQKEAAGSLFIIGGGTRGDALMKQLVETATLRPSDYIVV